MCVEGGGGAAAAAGPSGLAGTVRWALRVSRGPREKERDGG